MYLITPAVALNIMIAMVRITMVRTANSSAGSRVASNTTSSNKVVVAFAQSQSARFTSTSTTKRGSSINVNGSGVLGQKHQSRQIAFPSSSSPPPPSSFYSKTTRLFSNSSTDTAEKDRLIVQDMLWRVRECNNVPEEVRLNLMDFVIDGVKVGKVTNKVATLLCNSTPPSSSSSSTGGNPSVFEILNGHDSSSTLTLSDKAGKSIKERSDAVMSVMEHLRSKGIITGWRDELLPLSKGFYDEPVLFVERAAAPFLGMQQYGVHINGVVKSKSQGEGEGEGEGESESEIDSNGGAGERMQMWIARRSRTKSKYPGMLDHIVAGGQPAGLGLMENVLKECAEEAGISEEVTLAGIKIAGVVSYEEYKPTIANAHEYDGLITRCLLFNYDLDLPPDFAPKVVDGEVEEFFLWTIPQVVESMQRDYADPIKPNCYLVIIDFLLRKGYISPETPGYLDLIRELRGGYCG